MHSEVVDLAKSCVRYGFCTAVCPTYVLLGNENDSPRGRIALADQMVRSGTSPSAETVKHLDQCLSCLSCTSTCAARVDYGHIIDGARAYIEQHFKRPLLDRLTRSFLANVMPRPGLLKAFLTLAGFARPLSPVLPRRVATLLDVSPSLPAKTQSSPNPAQVQAGTRRVAYHSSCVQRVVAPHVDAAAIRFLRRHGCEVVEIAAPCCGALTLHMGRPEPARAAAASFIDACWQEMDGKGLDAVVLSASGCGTTIKDYPHLFRSAGSDYRRAKAVAALARDISELISAGNLTPNNEVAGYRVAYHDACSLAHGQKVTQPPRSLLAKLGVRVLGVPEGHFCCGSAGTYNLLQPELSGRLGERKARHIEGTSPDFAVAGNLGCIHQLSRHLKNVPIVHTVELLDWGTGGPRPKALEGVEPSDVADEPSNLSPLAATTTNRANEVELW